MRRPDWIRAKVPAEGRSGIVKEVLNGLSLNTVCVEADCPNKGECWGEGNATFIILGDRCTRDCRFCNVKKEVPTYPDPEEPEKVAEAVYRLKIKYAVITSVTRDDLDDGGAGHFIRTADSIRKRSPNVILEFLIPDFHADKDLLNSITVPETLSVIGHNIEMPESLYSRLRPRSSYSHSLDVIRHLSSRRDEGCHVFVKSSLMLGLGETDEDILKTLRDIKEAGADIIYLGQYLSPSAEHWPVEKYYTPNEFFDFRDICLAMGFRSVLSAPMVRSSYRAYQTYLELKPQI